MLLASAFLTVRFLYVATHYFAVLTAGVSLSSSSLSSRALSTSLAFSSFSSASSVKGFCVIIVTHVGDVVGNSFASYFESSSAGSSHLLKAFAKVASDLASGFVGKSSPASFVVFVGP